MQALQTLLYRLLDDSVLKQVKWEMWQGFYVRYAIKRGLIIDY